MGIPAVDEELERLDKAEFESRLSMPTPSATATSPCPGLFLLLIGAGLTERRRKEPQESKDEALA